MKNNYYKIKKQLEALKDENEYLKDNNKLLHSLNDITFNARWEADSENYNLQNLMLLSNQLNILMTDMLNYCDQNTIIGTAFKCAILQYQKVLAERMSCLDNDNENQTDDTWNQPLQ